MNQSPITRLTRSLLWILLNIKLFKRVFWALYKEFESHNNVLFERAVRDRFGDALQHGPYKGLKYPRLSHKGELILASKYLGTFEAEIVPFIESTHQRRYNQIHNIGAADGYYAVGSALRHPEAHVVAWEMLPYFSQVTKAVADANGVADRLELRGICEVDSLMSSSSAGGRTLIICDCEGAEDVLMDPEVLRGLAPYDLIIECHEMFAPGVTQRIRDRFALTHDIDEVETRLRSIEDVPLEILDILPRGKGEIVRAIEEPRQYRMTWLFISARD